MRVSMVSEDRLLSNLKNLGFHPKTVIDAGVANGTPWLYKAFPDAYFYLFEPVPTFQEKISEILRTIRGEHVNCALGSSEGISKFYIPKNVDIHEISTLCYEDKHVSPEAQFDVKVTTIDSFFSGKKISGPIFLKTDVQGFDLEVVKGSKKLLPHIDFVLNEIPIYGPWGGGSDIKDYIDFYYSNNFILYDLVEPLRRPDDDRLHSIDLCFANGKLPLAAKNLYTSGKQTIAKSLEYYKAISDQLIII